MIFIFQYAFNVSFQMLLIIFFSQFFHKIKFINSMLKHYKDSGFFLKLNDE